MSTEKILRTLVHVAQRLRDRHPDMTLLQAAFLFTIAEQEGINQRDLYTRLNTNDSVASRTVALLTDIGNRHTAGLDLVRMDCDPEDRRVKVLSLTPKGRRLIEDIVGDINKL